MVNVVVLTLMSSSHLHLEREYYLVLVIAVFPVPSKGSHLGKLYSVLVLTNKEEV